MNISSSVTAFSRRQRWCSALGLGLMTLAAAAPARAGDQAGPTASASATGNPTPAIAAASPAVDAPNLRARTREFEPGRFNLSVEGGLGLIRAVSPYSLRPGEFGAGGSVMNFDRNPGDVDFFEYGFQLAVGLPGRVEIFFRATPVLRTNSVNQEPFGYPVPPLDLFIDTYPNVAHRSQPYFLYAQEVPFKSYYVENVTIDPPGHGAFGNSSGDIAIGGKVNLLSEDRDDLFGLGVRGYIDIPTEQPSYNTADWQRVAGVSGKTDVGADVLFAKRFGNMELLANVGFEHVGDPERGLRVQFVDSSQWGTPGFIVGAPVETKLDLRDQLSFTTGTAVPAFNVNGLQFWLIGEFSYMRYVGAATRVERLVHPAEMRLGIQANVPKFPALSVGAAWQLLFNDAGDGSTRRSMFQTTDGKGDLNFTNSVDPALSSTLESVFAQQGATFSQSSSRVFSTNNAAFDDWRNIPVGETPVVGMGGGNILAFITWRIN